MRDCSEPDGGSGGTSQNTREGNVRKPGVILLSPISPLSAREFSGRGTESRSEKEAEG